MWTVLVVAAWLGAGESGTGFSVGIELPSQVPMAPSEEKALRELGIDYVNYYTKPAAFSPDDLAVSVNRGMLDVVERLGLDFSLSCFVVNPPDACVREAAERGGKHFKGIVFDELEHCRLLNNESDPYGVRCACTPGCNHPTGGNGP